MADPGGEAPETHARPAPSETYAANTRRDSWRESWVSAETHGGDSRRLTRRVTASHAPWVGDDDSACDYTLWYGRYYGGQIRCLQCLAAAIVASIITRFRYILLHCAMIVPWLWHVVPMRAIAWQPWLPPWQSSSNLRRPRRPPSDRSSLVTVTTSLNEVE